MPDPTEGTTPGAPEPAPATTGAGQTAQPAVAEPVKPNWDDSQNPWRQRHDGLQGNFKQLKAQHDMLQGRLAQIEAEQAARDAQAVQEARERRLRELSAEDDGPLAQEIKRSLDLQEAERQWQQKHLPGAYQHAAREVYASYQQGFGRAAQKYGLTNEDLAQIGQEHPQFDDFMDAVLERSVSRKLGTQNQNIEAQVQERVAEALKAHETRSAAERRAGSPVPDTTVAAPVLGSTTEDTSFWNEFARRKTGDRKSAEALVNRALR